MSRHINAYRKSKTHLPQTRSQLGADPSRSFATLAKINHSSHFQHRTCSKNFSSRARLKLSHISGEGGEAQVVYVARSLNVQNVHLYARVHTRSPRFTPLRAQGRSPQSPHGRAALNPGAAGRAGWLGLQRSCNPAQKRAWQELIGIFFP